MREIRLSMICEYFSGIIKRVYRLSSFFSENIFIINVGFVFLPTVKQRGSEYWSYQILPPVPS